MPSAHGACYTAIEVSLMKAIAELRVRRAEEAINDQMEFVFRGWATYQQVAPEVEFQKRRLRSANYFLFLQSSPSDPQT